MDTWCTVTSQVELDAAIADRKTHIEINALTVLELRVPDSFVPVVRSITSWFVRLLSGSVEARGSSRVEARDSSRVVARESSSVVARESSRVVAWESSSVVARESSSVVARESSSVEAWESSSVEARESSSVEAWESSSVEAWGSSRVVARESSSVVARESSSVEARESSSVVARESSRVVARGSSSVVARDSSRVVAWESSRVVARESSSVEARGSVALRVVGLSVAASATAMCAVHIEQSGSCSGGTQIVVPAILSIEQWCEFYGVDIVDGVAVLFKGVDDEFKSPRGGIYTPGTTPVASDWDGGAKECGGGFHFSPDASMTLEFAPQATKFVACPIRVSDIRHPKPDDSHPSKVKARGCCAPCYEVDRFGQKIATNTPTPVA